jgi:hypothetical protein
MYVVFRFRRATKDREEFLRDMKESDMMNKVFRILGGPSMEDLRKSRNKRRAPKREVCVH